MFDNAFTRRRKDYSNFQTKYFLLATKETQMKDNRKRLTERKYGVIIFWWIYLIGEQDDELQGLY